MAQRWTSRQNERREYPVERRIALVEADIDYMEQWNQQRVTELKRLEQKLDSLTRLLMWLFLSTSGAAIGLFTVSATIWAGI